MIGSVVEVNSVWFFMFRDGVVVCRRDVDGCPIIVSSPGVLRAVSRGGTSFWFQEAGQSARCWQADGLGVWDWADTGAIYWFDNQYQ
jgi:hypothetical protein